ncbi:MAG: hypothetical protein AAB510_00625 [Patescibacteria group bacterium]
MNKGRILLFLGIWVALLPYLGFPIFLKNILLSISGLVVIYFSYAIYKKDQKKDIKLDSFRENSDFTPASISKELNNNTETNDDAS